MRLIIDNGHKYDGESGYRLTDCCGAYSTYLAPVESNDGWTLHCKACFNEVPIGQGDGVETLTNLNVGD